MRVWLFACFMCLGSVTWAGWFGPSASDVKKALLGHRIGHSSKNQRTYRIEVDSVKVCKSDSDRDCWTVEYVTNMEREGRIRWTARVKGGKVNGEFGGMAHEEKGVRIDVSGRAIDGKSIPWDSCPPVPAGIAKTASEFEAAWKSICGYSFAKDYTMGRVDANGDPPEEVKCRLNPSYRYMTRIVLQHGYFDAFLPNERGGYSNYNLGYGMYEARLGGALPRNWSKEQIEAECETVAHELEKRFGVVLLKIAECHYLYQNSTARKTLIVMLSPTYREVSRTGVEREIEVIVTNRDVRPKPKVRPVECFGRGGSGVL